jgi:putative ABC transport system substrate-binding protein
VLRRDVIALIASAVVAWPGVARAQQPQRNVPLVGAVWPGERFAAITVRVREAFQRGLREDGYIEGQNIAIEHRYGEGLDGLRNAANEFVRLNVDVILALGTPAILAAKRATSTIPIVGAGMADSVADGLVAGLARPGGVDGKNVAIEYRWAEGRYDRLAAIVDELVRLKVAVISTGGNVAALAARRGTQTIPIVFNVAADPVKLGLVVSLSRPGGNATGIATLTAPLTTKRLELIGEIVAPNTAIGFLVNPDNDDVLADVLSAAQASGQRLIVVKARTAEQFEKAFASVAEAQVGGLLVANDSFFLSERERLIALAARYALPAVYEFPDFPASGGLMSYGPRLSDLYRLVGTYAGRILGGAKPADLPVQQATKLLLVVNLKTAKALGLTIPPSILARADEVIE